MSTMPSGDGPTGRPPSEPTTTSAGTTGGTTTTTSTGGPGSAPPPLFGGNMPDVARLPIPGNAEFAVYLGALLVAMLVCWRADELGTGAWLSFFQWTTIAYILSRGVAKASRVLEQ